MDQAISNSETVRDPIATAQLHAALRFATGITASFVLCEYMQWTPTCLAPLFFAVLVTSLPGPPPLKIGVALVVLMTAAALTAFLVTTLLRFSPAVMVGVIGIIVFFALGALANQRAQLPAMLLLIAMAIIPVVGLLAPAHADELPRALVRGMAIAVVTIWCVYILWPKVLPKAAQPARPPIESPVKMALAGTLILLPLMMVYMMFGWADALPVLISTVLLVINFDPREGATQAMYRNVGSLVGGVVGLVAFMLLSIMPSLVTLALITFVIGLEIGPRIEKAGLRGPLVLQAFNTGMVIFGTAIASPNDSSGIWMTRLFQFTLAGFFAVAMMYLVFRREWFAAKTQGNAR